MSYAWPPGSTDTQMTSVADGRTHTIAGAEFDAGVWQGHGRYRAVCGAEVIAASLMSGPGPQCPACPVPCEPEHAPERAYRLRAALATLPGFAALAPQTAQRAFRTASQGPARTAQARSVCGPQPRRT